MMLWAFYILVILSCVFLLPGYLFLRHLYKKLNFLECAALGLAFGILAIPLISFSLAWLLGTVVTNLLVYAIVLSISLPLIFALRNRKVKLMKLKFSKTCLTLSLIVLFTFLFFLLNFEGPTMDYWDTYITAPAMFLSNHPINLTSIEGIQLYKYQLAGKVPQNLVDMGSYGIITEDQRLGSAVIFSLPFLFFGIFGFRLFNAVIIALAFLIFYFVARRIFKREWLCILVPIILIFNPFTLSINRLNPNLIALFITSVLFFFLLYDEKNYPVLGILYGILGSVRYEAIIFAPAILLFFYKMDRKRVVRNTMIFAVSAFVAILPFLLWNKFAFGGFLIHPTQSPLLSGFRPVFPHSLFGLKFNFNGLLNYPLYGKVVRTPHFPFPTFLMLPLVVIKSFGLVLFSLMIYGIPSLIRKNRNLSIFLLCWLAILLVFLMPQENWDEFKMTYIILMFPSISIFIVSGIESAVCKASVRKTIIVVLIIASLFFLIRAIHGLNFQADERWYERFPHANERHLTYLNDSQRMSWEFFHAGESADEILLQKNRITSPSLLPRFYLFRQGNILNSAFKIPQEIGKKELTAVAIWEYVYG